jgi:hypothetical protein
MAKLCYSCSMPLSDPENRGPSDIYCKYCTDSEGNLKPRPDVTRGIALWLKSWQTGITDAEAKRRAQHFMKAMPAWAQAK